MHLSFSLLVRHCSQVRRRARAHAAQSKRRDVIKTTRMLAVEQRKEILMLMELLCRPRWHFSVLCLRPPLVSVCSAAVQPSGVPPPAAASAGSAVRATAAAVPAAGGTSHVSLKPLLSNFFISTQKNRKIARYWRNALGHCHPCTVRTCTVLANYCTIY